MAVIKEFFCIEHGDFEGSHPICPADGCASEAVEQVFRTPPKISKGKFKRFDASTRRSADLMKISDFNAKREGDVAFKGRGTDAPEGMGILWGDQASALGHSFAEMTALANKPLAVGKQDRYARQNNALAGVMTESESFQKASARQAPLAAEVHSAEEKERGRAKALVT